MLFDVSAAPSWGSPAFQSPRQEMPRSKGGLQLQPQTPGRSKPGTNAETGGKTRKHPLRGRNTFSQPSWQPAELQLLHRATERSPEAQPGPARAGKTEAGGTTVPSYPFSTYPTLCVSQGSSGCRTCCQDQDQFQAEQGVQKGLQANNCRGPAWPQHPHRAWG